MSYSEPATVEFRCGWLSAGFAAGVVLMMPLVLALLALGIRVWDSHLSPIMLTTLIGQGLLTGPAVGLIEETCFRGVIYGAIRRESGIVLATLLTTALYATLAFSGRKSAHPDGASHIPQRTSSGR